MQVAQSVRRFLDRGADNLCPIDEHTRFTLFGIETDGQHLPCRCATV